MRIEMDLELGTPVVDFNGNIVQANYDRAFNQYINVMLNTPLFTELFLLSWGIPIREIFAASFNLNWQNTVRYLLLQVLNPQNEPLIKEVKSMEVERNDDDVSIDIDLHLTSTFGTELKGEVKLNE